MENPIDVFLKIERDPDDPLSYRISSIFPTGEYDKDLGYYDRGKLLEELGGVKRAILEGLINVNYVKVDKSVTNSECKRFYSIDDAIKFFETEDLEHEL